MAPQLTETHKMIGKATGASGATLLLCYMLNQNTLEIKLSREEAQRGREARATELTLRQAEVDERRQRQDEINKQQLKVLNELLELRQAEASRDPRLPRYGHHE